METYTDGSEKANYNVFKKKDLIQDNMEFEKDSKYTFISTSSKKKVSRHKSSL